MPAHRTVYLTHAGETLPLAEWVARTGIPATTILSRVRRLGWPAARALTTPADTRFKRGKRPHNVAHRPPPKLEQHATGQAYCRWREHGKPRAKYFGAWASDTARQRYARFVAEWVANQGQVRTPGERQSVGRLCEGYFLWAREYYRKNGQPTTQVSLTRRVLRLVNDLHGDEPAEDFTPDKLRTCQAQWVAAGYARKTVNESVHRVRLMFSWAAGRSLVPAAVADALRHVENLKRGRTAAREPGQVRAVPGADVEATIPHLHPEPGRQAVLAAMIRVQLLSRMRPGELCAMTPAKIDRGGKVWAYDVAEVNKTLHLGGRRIVYIGPKAQAILAPFLATIGGDEFVWRFPVRGRNGMRRSRVSQGSYGRFIGEGCKRAKVPHWTPNQLRHAGATLVQRLYEDDAMVAAALGNTPEVARQVYVDDPAEAVSKRIAQETG